MTPVDEPRTYREPSGYPREARTTEGQSGMRGKMEEMGDRPAGVLAIVLLFGAAALFMLIGSFAVLGEAAEAAGSAVLFGLLVVVVSALALAIAYGAWTQAKWAWFAGLALGVVGGVTAIIALLSGTAAVGVLGLLVAAAVVFLFLLPDVQSWFGVEAMRAARAGRPA